MKNLLKLENNNIFAGFENHPMATAYLKETLQEVWRDEEELLDKTCHSRFRSPLDVSQSVFRYRQLARGKFHPVSKRSRGKFLHIGLDNKELEDAILTSKYKMLCINDTPENIDFDQAKSELIAVYEKRFPKKSMFEL